MHRDPGLYLRQQVGLGRRMEEHVDHRWMDGRTRESGSLRDPSRRNPRANEGTLEVDRSPERVAVVSLRKEDGLRHCRPQTGWTR